MAYPRRVRQDCQKNCAYLPTLLWSVRFSSLHECYQHSASTQLLNELFGLVHVKGDPSDCTSWLMALANCCCEIIVWSLRLTLTIMIELGFPHLKPTDVYDLRRQHWLNCVGEQHASSWMQQAHRVACHDASFRNSLFWMDFINLNVEKCPSTVQNFRYWDESFASRHARYFLNLLGDKRVGDKFPFGPF